MTTWPEVLAALVARTDLTVAQTTWAMGEILAGEATEAQIAGFAIGLKAKGETVEEVSGLAEAMYAARTPIAVPGRLLDVVGTGGDRSMSVNISTMAAIVAAGAGAKVVKHGARSASSASGSADVLEQHTVDRPDLGGRRGRQLVEAVVAAEHPRVDAASGEHPGHQRRHPGVGAADRLRVGARRVGEWTEDVEGRGDAELAPGHRRMPQGGVERRREAEGDPDLLTDAGDGLRGQVEPDAERLEDVGRARLRRRGPVAVLDDRCTRTGRDDGGHRRDVHRHRSVTAGADDVQHPAGDDDRGGVLVHRGHQTLELVDGLALRAQRDGEAGDLRRGRLAGQDLVHRPGCLSGGQVVSRDQGRQDFGPGVRGGHGVSSGYDGRAARRGRGGR